MDIENKVDLNATPTVAPEVQPQEPSQPNPLQKELDKIENQKSGRSKREKLEFTLNRVKQQLAEIDGVDPVIVETTEDKSKPLTIAEYERIQRDNENNKAVDLAEDIEDDTERKLTVHYLENVIKPSGNAEVDLANARAIVNAKRNALIAEEAQRVSPANHYSSAPGGPGKRPEEVFEPTAEEASMMRAPFNLTKEDVIKARQREQMKRG